ncbi:MAG TPA: hypothetical protein VFA52_01855 [Candidatus Paceibacterota bacterium]|nr:hypothetical protein [Candidatus Paceibacterota bacterium]
MIRRLIIDLLLLLTIFLGPWWLSLLLLLMPLFYFSRPPFYEALFVGFLLDILYGLGEDRVFLFSLIFTTTTFILLIAINLFKTRLKYY